MFICSIENLFPVKGFCFPQLVGQKWFSILVISANEQNFKFWGNFYLVVGVVFREIAQAGQLTLTYLWSLYLTLELSETSFKCNNQDEVCLPYFILSAHPICSMQEEELARNSVMLDLLYVFPSHPLVSQISFYYQLYYQSPPHARFAWAINTNLRLVLVAFCMLTYCSNCPCMNSLVSLPIVSTFSVVEWMDSFGYLRGTALVT